MNEYRAKEDIRIYSLVTKKNGKEKYLCKDTGKDILRVGERFEAKLNKKKTQ